MAKTQVDCQIGTNPPFVLHEETIIWVVLRLVWNPERLLKLVIVADQEIRKIVKRENTLNCTGKLNVYFIEEKFTAEFDRVATDAGAKTVIYLKEVDIAACWGECCRSETGNSRDINGRTIQIVHWCSEPAPTI